MTAPSLHDKLASASVRLEEYSGASTAADFGDVAAEFRALVAGCGVYDLSWRAKIAVSGNDRVRWLNGMASNNIRDLATGFGVYAFLLNPQGRILADLYAYKREDSLFVDTDQSQAEKVLATFKRFIIMDRVELANVSDHLTAIGVAGSNSRTVLRAAGLQFPELAPLQFADVTWQQTQITIARGDNPAVETFELWLAPTQAPVLWEALAKAGATPVGTTALELLRIAAGVPRYGQDINERDLPQETEQQRALSFTKGCYIGQEIVERIRSRGAVHRKFTGFLVDGPLPAPGTKIQSDGKEVGEITSAASLPLASGERHVALGYIRREAAEKSLQAGEVKVVVAETPFAGVWQKETS